MKIKLHGVTTDLGYAHQTNFVTRRRTALMLTIGSLIGIVSPSTRARAESSGTNGDGNMPAASHDAGQLRNTSARQTTQFQCLKNVGSEHQVMSVGYHQDGYEVRTADGRSSNFLTANLRFKVDAGATGPSPGKPVILPAGRMGDRASVFVASPTEISELIEIGGPHDHLM